MKAYLEKCGNEWFDDFVYTSRQTLEDRGIEVIGFDGSFLKEFIDKTEFGPDDIVVGSVEATVAFWKKLGFEIPKYIGYPNFSEINPWKRKIETTTFKGLTNYKFPIFIKPKNDVKLFTGMVLDTPKNYQSCQQLYPEIYPDLEVYVSEVLDIKSEWRCFIHKNKLVGIKHYDGDFTKFIDTDLIEEIILNFDESPVSYTIDLGYFERSFENGDVHSRGTCLVEINDFWAIGGYGLDSKIYNRMLIDRFQEIKNKNLNGIRGKK